MSFASNSPIPDPGSKGLKQNEPRKTRSGKLYYMYDIINFDAYNSFKNNGMGVTPTTTPEAPSYPLKVVEITNNSNEVIYVEREDSQNPESEDELLDLRSLFDKNNIVRGGKSRKTKKSRKIPRRSNKKRIYGTRRRSSRRK